MRLFFYYIQEISNISHGLVVLVKPRIPPFTPQIPTFGQKMSKKRELLKKKTWQLRGDAWGFVKNNG